MKVTLRLSVAVVALAASLVGAAGAGAAPGRVAPDRSAALAKQLRAGTLGRDHDVADGCVVRYHGRPLDLGCRHSLVTAGKGSVAPLATAAPTGYGPGELATAFHIPADGGTAGSSPMIAIVGVGAYPNLEADLATYRGRYHLPACTTGNGCLTITGYRGGPALPANPVADQLGLEQVYAQETALDVDMASASCPSCKITMVQIPFDLLKILSAATMGLPGPLAADFGTAVNQAVTLGAHAISMSYGLPTGNQAALLGAGAVGKALDHPGVAVLASSGDSGYTGEKMSWPNYLPWVTSVGGVTLKAGDHGGYGTSAWGELFTKKNPDGSTTPTWVGAGSGCATDLPAAVGQPGPVSAVCQGHRSTTDVSADADPLTGVAVYDSWATGDSKGGWLTFGGTSASSPWIAGLYARRGVTGVHGPNTVYAAPAGSVTDVVGGTNAPDGAADCTAYGNSLCTGVPGWDGPTGVGVPHGLGAF